MLGVLFRGVFFLGVIGWYSSSLWRMIDGYFKDQFQRYLEEEYRRNPKMRDNVAINNVIPAAADKLENPPPIDTDDARLVAESLQDTCSSDGDKCQADTVEPRRESRSSSSSLAGELVAVAENEVARPVEQSEFLREEEDRGGSGNSGAGHDDDDVTTTAATTTSEPLPLDRIDEQTFSSRAAADVAVDDDNIEEINIEVSSGRVAIEESKPREEKATKAAAAVVPKPAARKRRKSSARSPTSIGAKPATSKVGKKRKIKLLSLTNEDFERAREQRRRKYKRFNEQEEEEEDFSEFDDSYWDDDHREQEEQTGVLVLDLPFKPAIDIYDLERLPEDEFCPLTLEDDPTCEETRSWPMRRQHQRDVEEDLYDTRSDHSGSAPGNPTLLPIHPRLQRNFYPASLQCLLKIRRSRSTLAFSRRVKRMAIKFHRSLRSYLKYKASRHSRGTRSTHATRLLPALNNPLLLHTPIHTYRRLQSNLPIRIFGLARKYCGTYTLRTCAIAASRITAWRPVVRRDGTFLSGEKSCTAPKCTRFGRIRSTQTARRYIARLEHMRVNIYSRARVCEHRRIGIRQVEKERIIASRPYTTTFNRIRRASRPEARAGQTFLTYTICTYGRGRKRGTQAAEHTYTHSCYTHIASLEFRQKRARAWSRVERANERAWTRMTSQNKRSKKRTRTRLSASVPARNARMKSASWSRLHEPSRSGIVYMKQQRPVHKRDAAIYAAAPYAAVVARLTVEVLTCPNGVPIAEHSTVLHQFYSCVEMCEDPEINKLKDDVKEHTAAVRARHIVAALVAVGFALCGAVETSSSVALLANQVDNHAIIDTSWHCDMLVNLSRRNRTEDAEFGRTELSLEERDESRMREAFLWGQVAGPILGGCLVWGRTGPSMVFSRAVLSACLASLLVPAAWRGPSHVALRLLQGLCTVGQRVTIVVIHTLVWNCRQRQFFNTNRDFRVAGCHDACRSHARHDMVQKHAQKLVFQLLRSCKCRLLSYWLARHGGGESLRKRLAVLRSHDTGIVLVLHFRPLRQRQSQILSTRYQSHFIPAALLFVAGYAGCQALGAAWLGIAALLVSGTAPAGALAAIADLAPAESPACAAAACALCSTLGAAGLLAANYFVTQALHASIAGSWRLVFGVASIVLLITAAVFLALGKGVPQPWIPSVARPCSHDVIYEQDGLELDYEDVAVQTEPYDLYGADDDEEDNPKDIEKEQKESNSLQTTVAVIKNETNNYIIKANIEVYV
ncbi:unnamed protein product [Trichogramma brassicae]|uniref:Major facilitator superfamily (MFS) profile domain-containing protein n=1 Tax=Trichogramma brassicae TaxID=86971 RepID=A0A6H5IR08_9HYME|nr:unnamed protein product [Trichogramma brassicae]